MEHVLGWLFEEGDTKKGSQLAGLRLILAQTGRVALRHHWGQWPVARPNRKWCKMSTGYFDRSNNYTPPPNWNQSTEARRILSTAYARKLTELAIEFESPNETEVLADYRCKRKRGK